MNIHNEQWHKDKHEEMWQWLADNPTKDKDQWGGWDTIGEGLGYPSNFNHCFSCKWAKHTHNTSQYMCDFCPCWEPSLGSAFQCEHPYSPYSKWEQCFATYNEEGELHWNEGDKKLRRKLALKIKNKWREILK